MPFSGQVGKCTAAPSHGFNIVSKEVWTKWGGKKIYGEVQLKHSSSFSLIFRNAQPRIPPKFGVVIDI